MDMQSVSEVEPLNHETQRRIAELRQEVSVGLEELKLGKSVPGEQVFEELRRRSEAKSR